MKFPNWKDITFCIASGIFVGTSYPPFPGWALLFCLAPLWVTCFRQTTRFQVFVCGFVTQFLLTLIGFNWVAFVAREFGNIPYILSIFVLLGFCLFASLHIALGVFISFSVHQKWKLSPLGFFLLTASITAFLENVYPMIFPWNMGYPLLFSHVQAAQTAEIIGFAGLSFILFVINALVSESLRAKQFKIYLPIVALILVILEISGAFLRNQVPQPDKNVRVLLVQPNIGNFDKFYAERGAEYKVPVVEKIFGLTRAAWEKQAQKPDLIVWPETAFPDELDQHNLESVYPKRLREFLGEIKSGLVTGGYSEDAEDRRKSYNGMFLMGRDGNLAGSYRKHLLLAFGEYFPGSEYFPILKKIVPEVGNFGRGIGPGLLTFEGLKLSPLICYEILYPSYLQKTLELGGQVLVNLTNDSWFGTNFEPYQHQTMSIARGVEFRRPLIRSTNTGVTSISNALGEILVSGPQNIEWSEIVDLKYLTNPPDTFYYKFGHYLVLFIFLFSLSIAVLFRERKNV